MQILVAAAEWERWLQDTCTRNGWKHSASPLVWRELVDRGGKGLYMGGMNEFLDYAHHYYGMEPTTTAHQEAEIAVENDHALRNVHSKEERTVHGGHIVVCITDASSPLAYHLLWHIAAGTTFNQQPVELHLLDEEEMLPQLEGTAMELIDMASPHLVGVVCSSSPDVAFANASVALILGPADHSCPTCTATQDNSPATDDAVQTGDQFSITPQLTQVALTYVRYAQAMDKVSLKNIKVLVCGHHINTGVALIARTALSLDKHNIVGSPTLMEQRARSIVASKLHLNASCVGHVGILGRARGEVAVDLSLCQVQHYPGAVTGPPSFSLPVDQCILDPHWLQTISSLVTTRPTLAVMCEAAGISEHMSSWMNKSAEWRSVVIGPGGCALPEVPDQVAFSVTATCSSGHWSPITATLPPHLLPSIRQQGAALQQELQVVMDALHK